MIDRNERIRDERLEAIIREDAADPARGCDSFTPHEVAMLAWEVDECRRSRRIPRVKKKDKPDA